MYREQPRPDAIHGIGKRSHRRLGPVYLWQTDIHGCALDVRLVPTGDISRVARSPDPLYNISWVGLQAMVQKRPERVERRLWAILAADVACYSRIMQNIDEASLASLTASMLLAVG